MGDDVASSVYLSPLLFSCRRRMVGGWCWGMVLLDGQWWGGWEVVALRGAEAEDEPRRRRRRREGRRRRVLTLGTRGEGE